MIKRVAIVGADFVPSSLPPALRIRFFSKHLPEFGWEPVIITTNSDFYECNIDPENEQLLSETLKIIRTPALSAKWTRKIGIGDIGIRSMWHHWRKLCDLSKKNQIDLLFIPVPPYVPMILGRLINKRFGIPYIIDYIDPWVTEYYWQVPKSQRPPKWILANAVSRIMEPYALKNVSHIVSVDKSYIGDLPNRYSWLTESDLSGIPYGIEPMDFDFLRKNPRQNKIFDCKDGLVHLVYTGRGGVDLLLVLESLFSAIKLGLKKWPELFLRLRVHFIGTNYASESNITYQVFPLAKKMDIQQIITEHPTRISYLDALQTMLDSHGLLALGSDSPHYTASKIFPYILAQKPLLAIFNEASSVVRILKELKVGHVITFNSQHSPIEKVENILQYLKNFILQPHQLPLSINWDIFENYTAKAMTMRLVKAFEVVLTSNTQS